MILVAGLGNIGDKYEKTRHNVGFMLIDLILKENQAQKISNSKFKGELYKIGSSLLLLKPHTFMNNSGESVKAVNDFYKCDKFIIIHDDIDIPLNALRFKKGGSSGGHNGLKSIDSLCGNDYERIRIGVGKTKDVINHVLGNFSDDEFVILNKVLEQAKKALFELINSNIENASSKYTMKNIKN